MLREAVMILRQSRFLHAAPLSGGRTLLVHAVSHLRLVIDSQVRQVVDLFAIPRRLPDDIEPLANVGGYALETLVGCIASLLERGFLTELEPEAELAQVSAKLDELYGRDPDSFIEQYRRGMKAGAEADWAVTRARSLADLAPGGPRIQALLFGDCEIQMEAEFLREEAARRGVDLLVAATFPDDVRFAAERAHDVILVGALRSRRTIPFGPAEAPYAAWLAEARQLIEALRARSAAPILIDALPEPTVQPLGMADRGPDGHRNRFRRANLALAELVESFADVHLVDIPAVLAAEGAAARLDDGLVGFTHFGAPGWMLQRPASERAAVHDLFPDPTHLARLVGGDPYLREGLVARAHMDALATALGIGRKKVVVVDLDGVLWPGVLAETGAPFAWTPETSGLYSYVGLYVGLHEALKTLKRRGVLLACVSKNDEAVVRELWRFDSHYPHERLLTPDDFVTWRVNWTDKVDNIVSISQELGLALDSFVFIDDREIERENVARRLPEVEVWGEDLFALRRRLLDDPRLQVPRLTAESGARTDLVKAQLGRERLRSEAGGAEDFLQSLQVRCAVERLLTTDADRLQRVEELFQRTTQFNTTGRKFPVAALTDLLTRGAGSVFVLQVQDRFGDHGLVGAAVIEAGEITGLAMSCRVIGIGAEHAFMSEIIAAMAAEQDQLFGRIIASARNAPVRNLYRDNGFDPDGCDGWRLRLDEAVRGAA